MMMKGAGLAILGLTLIQDTSAECPNACSGHGVCGEFDACTCYPDWLGGDCSERACPTGWAWVVTNANGDINSDGNLNGITIYDADHYFTESGLSYVISQNEPHGTWESWPAFGNTGGVDEGHYYMECSNMGICDRETGFCNCFAGYEGAGCQRSTCPNSCSGHGVCKTVSQTKGTGVSYDLWDKDMTRSCVCDGGYTGPDCSQRKCPVGDDPLTTGQQYETQYVDIYTDINGVTDMSFSGYIKLKYTDQNGVEWVTDGIAVQPYAGSATGMATAVENALNSLPNDVLRGVTVTEGFMERVLPGTVEVVTANALSADPGVTMLRCPAQASHANVVLYTSDGGTSLTDYAGTAYTTLENEIAVCNEVLHYWSVRLAIHFPSTAGDLPALEVDVSNVEANSQTNAMAGSTIINSAVSSSKTIATPTGTDVAYTHPDDVTDETCTGGVDSCTITSATKTIAGPATTNWYPKARLRITCATKLLGTYTVSSITDGTTAVLEEDIPACTAAEDLTISLVSYAFHVSGPDLTNFISVGDRLSVTTFADVSPKISTWSTYDTSNTDMWIVLQSEHVGDDTANGGETTATGATVAIYSEGTTEANECSDRGICDRETGVCRCFSGYTGYACNLQNALSV